MRIANPIAVVLVAATFCTAGEPDEAAIKAAFDAAKTAHAEQVKKLTQLGVARRLNDDQKKELRALRNAKSVTPKLEYKLGSVGLLEAGYSGSAGSRNVSEITIYGTRLRVEGNRVVPVSTSTEAVLEKFDNSKLTPGDSISVIVYLDRFDGRTAIYRPIDLAPYTEKFGKLK